MRILSSLLSAGDDAFRAVANQADDVARGAVKQTANMVDDVARSGARSGQKLLAASNDKFSDYNLSNLLDNDTAGLLNLYSTAGWDKVSNFLNRQANQRNPISVAAYDTLDELSDDAYASFNSMFSDRGVDLDSLTGKAYDAYTAAEDDYINDLLRSQGYDTAEYGGKSYLYKQTDNPYVGVDGANRLFDDAAAAFSPNYDVSRSWGAGEVPSTYVPFFDEQIRIANHDNSYSHPYGMVYDPIDLIRGGKTLSDVERDIVDQMDEAVADGIVVDYLDNMAGYEGSVTFEDLDDALSRAVGRMNSNFMSYGNGELAMGGMSPMKITQATPYSDIEDYIIEGLRNRRNQLRG